MFDKQVLLLEHGLVNYDTSREVTFPINHILKAFAERNQPAGVCRAFLLDR